MGGSPLYAKEAFQSPAVRLKRDLAQTLYSSSPSQPLANYQNPHHKEASGEQMLSTNYPHFEQSVSCLQGMALKVGQAYAGRDRTRTVQKAHPGPALPFPQAPVITSVAPEIPVDDLNDFLGPGEALSSSIALDP